MKNRYRGWDCLKRGRGLRQSADLKGGGGLARKRGVVFLRREVIPWYKLWKNTRKP